ncbi:MAG: alpha/beta hydrolase [Pyrinomonadaceae bacterium]|nr:alpha/beta hydrolase [Pyrinomonadaceae bacterium]
MSAAGKLWKTMLAGGAGVATLAALNASISRRNLEPEESLPESEKGIFKSKHGNVYYRHAGKAATNPPILFIHSIDAGASSFMWRRNFTELSEDFQVYAPDLLGFGLSAKPADAPYSADLYVELIAEFIEAIVKRPACVVANNLGAAFATRVADEHREKVCQLLLVSPASADSSRLSPGMTGAAFYGLLHSPVLGASFYNAMASERSIRDHARRHLFYDKRLATRRLVAQLYAMSHQPAAQHAIAAFLSGYLNTDAREAFARLTQPVTLVWGKQDRTNPLTRANELLRLNPHAKLEIFDRARLWAHEEHPERFNALTRRLLLKARSAAA